MKHGLVAARDMGLGMAPWVPGHGRYGLESLTSAELGETIGAGVPGARLESHEVVIDSRGTTDRARSNSDTRHPRQ